MEESAARIVFHLIDKKKTEVLAFHLLLHTYKRTPQFYLLHLVGRVNSTAHGTTIRSRFCGKELSTGQKNRSRVSAEVKLISRDGVG